MSKYKKKHKDILSIMSNLQPNCCLKIDFQKMDQHVNQIALLVHFGNMVNKFWVIFIFVYARVDIAFSRAMYLVLQYSIDVISTLSIEHEGQLNKPQ